MKKRKETATERRKRKTQEVIERRKWEDKALFQKIKDRLAGLEKEP